MSEDIIKYFLGGINFNFLKLVSKNKVILPLYHTVSDKELPHITHLYQVKNVKRFKSDLDFLLRNYQSVDIKEIIHTTKNDGKFKKPVFHLSFDDGLKEVRTIIAPILLEKGVHATFFLNPSFLDNQSLFYRFKVSLIIDALKRFDFSDVIKKEIKSLLINFDGGSIQKQLLNITYNHIDVLDEIGGLLNISFEGYLEKESPFLSTDDIHWLISKGFTIGAHSLDHPKYPDIPLEEQLYQTKESLNYLEVNFDIKEKLFAFPFSDIGVSDDFFKKIFKENVLSFGTSGLSKQKHKFNLQRIPMEREQISQIDILKLQYLKCLLNA
jgi:peptidoglycan/xylan/chitin deacetylase (PgdA/CDA1 family)